jgi:hypothetical protein
MLTTDATPRVPVAIDPHAGHSHPHSHPHEAPRRVPTPAAAAARRRSLARPSLFLASALDRLLIAIVLVGLLWIAVLWAVA